MVREDSELCTAAARLLLNLVPGIDSSMVFQESEDLVSQLFRWAQDAAEPLRSYATGLLAAAMDVSEIASACRDQNSVLVPLMLQRLRTLQKQAADEERLTEGTSEPFAKLKAETFSVNGDDRPRLSEVVRERANSRTGEETASTSEPKTGAIGLRLTPGRSRSSAIRVKRKSGGESDGSEKRPTKRLRFAESEKDRAASGNWSGSSWAELQPFVIGKHCLFPLNTVVQQRLILQYLAPVGEYQDVSL